MRGRPAGMQVSRAPIPRMAEGGLGRVSRLTVVPTTPYYGEDGSRVRCRRRRRTRDSMAPDYAPESAGA